MVDLPTADKEQSAAFIVSLVLHALSIPEHHLATAPFDITLSEFLWSVLWFLRFGINSGIGFFPSRVLLRKSVLSVV